MTQQELFQTAIKKAGWDLGLVSLKQFGNKPLTGTQSNIANNAFTNKNSSLLDLSSDAIYFAGDYPVIHFKLLDSYNKEHVNALQQKIWNEGQSPFLAVVTPDQIQIFDCYKHPVDLENFTPITGASYTERDLNRLALALGQSKIDTGKIWEPGELGARLRFNQRVDKKLIEFLKGTRTKLHKNGKGLPLKVIHDLLGRALFVFYLEDSGILNAKEFPNKPDGVNSFYELLDHPEATYELFNLLRIWFNGDLFPVSVEEKNGVDVTDLREVRNCFYGVDPISKQGVFWKMFQFKFIPIELISAIYEEFMSGVQNGKLKTKQEGAYYTKRMLVDFMLNEVLPWPNETEASQNYNIKIMDPACGSGIFLVESFKRLIARWKKKHEGSAIKTVDLENILLNSIYGIDKDTEAIKVAAFSLYLTFLNYLEPEEVKGRLRIFTPLTFWSDLEMVKEAEDLNKRPGFNLFQCHTFEFEEFWMKSRDEIESPRFDLIVGNPPWKVGEPDEILLAYDKQERQKRKRIALPSQIACYYLEYLPQILTSDGTIAVVGAAKILFNTGNGYEEFRKRFFSENKVDAIINLAVVRDIMFDKASAPGAVIIYRKINQRNQNDFVMYCIPKNIQTIKDSQSVVIDATEIKRLPVNEILCDDSKIFKIAMWGGMRDVKFIKRLKTIKSIKNRISTSEWGIGLKTKDKKAPAGNKHLIGLPFIEPEDTFRYVIRANNLKNLGDDHKEYRTNNKNIFKTPIVLIKEGTKNAEICSAYVGFDAVYRNSTLGISIVGKNSDFHKALLACINSDLASYFYFMTSSLWGVDRGGQVQNTDALSFPALPYEMSEDGVAFLAQKVDDILAIRTSSQVETYEEERILSIEKEINERIYKELKISVIEQRLIHDALNFSIALKKKYTASDAEGNSEIEKDIYEYAEQLNQTLSRTLKYTKKAAWAEVFAVEKDNPVNLVTIHFADLATAKQKAVQKSEIDVNRQLKEINKYIFHKHSESLYYRKAVRYHTQRSIYLIKPNERRFWTISQALNDADTIISEMINAQT